MLTVHTVAELHAALQPWRRAGDTTAFVPTMGNLHAGHGSLVDKARELGECVVVSIFVNPLQFGPKEDFEKYPRTLEADGRLLDKAGVDVVFAPSVRDLYPGGYPPATTVSVDGPLTKVLCAPFRPGHFTGVATIVNILFNVVRPDIAVFGEKDYQQLAVIRRMVADLGLAIRIVGAPTLRDADGLALSSRNQYLSSDERLRAARLHETLQWVAGELRGGRRDFAMLSQEAQGRLAKARFNPQYVEVRTTDLDAPGENPAELVVLAAAYLGTTRLIDNVAVRL
ncbi:MAG TPA: pantoate--beta-alanine ligase [Verrucomicrobiae bacterium]|nr:pantoate--beta-alanine ligase [Verrucomicrobiae bacterium]